MALLVGNPTCSIRLGIVSAVGPFLECLFFSYVSRASSLRAIASSWTHGSISSTALSINLGSFIATSTATITAYTSRTLLAPSTTTRSKVSAEILNDTVSGLRWPRREGFAASPVHLLLGICLPSNPCSGCAAVLQWPRANGTP